MIRDYVVRQQSGGHVDVEIRGERAIADSEHTLWMDTVTARWLAHSKPYIYITASSARVAQAASGERHAEFARAVATLYLGGRFESDSLAVDLSGGGLDAQGEVWFERKPVLWRAAAIRSAEVFDGFEGERLVLSCGPATASARRFRFDLESRTLDLSGDAIYKSGQRVIRRDRLQLKFNSQFTELTLVGNE